MEESRNETLKDTKVQGRGETKFEKKLRILFLKVRFPWVDLEEYWKARENKRVESRRAFHRRKVEKRSRHVGKGGDGVEQSKPVQTNVGTNRQ